MRLPKNLPGPPTREQMGAMRPGAWDEKQYVRGEPRALHDRAADGNARKRASTAGRAARDHDLSCPKRAAPQARPGHNAASAVETPATPRLDRDVPFFVEEAHEVNSPLDYDWTLSPDWGRELRLREIRNHIINDKLEMGSTVAFRQSGWSCYPKISSNDLCFYEPVHHDPANIDVDDIVFCEVEPARRFYTHVVKKVSLQWYEKYSRYEWCYTISDLAGTENGCFIDQVYGKLFKVMA